MQVLGSGSRIFVKRGQLTEMLQIYFDKTIVVGPRITVVNVFERPGDNFEIFLGDTPQAAKKESR